MNADFAHGEDFRGGAGFVDGIVLRLVNMKQPERIETGGLYRIVRT